MHGSLAAGQKFAGNLYAGQAASAGIDDVADAVGTVAGPQAIGAAIDITGNDGFAWAIAGFFALYVVLSLARLLFSPKRT